MIRLQLLKFAPMHGLTCVTPTNWPTRCIPLLRCRRTSCHPMVARLRKHGRVSLNHCGSQTVRPECEYRERPPQARAPALQYHRGPQPPPPAQRICSGSRSVRKPKYFSSIYPDAQFEDSLPVVEAEVPSQEDALKSMLAGWLTHLGPTTARCRLAALLHLPMPEIRARRCWHRKPPA